MKDSVIRARIDSKLKARAVEVLAACGLEPSDAIRLFLQQVVAHRGLPFDVRSAGRDLSFSESQALKRQAQERDHHSAAALASRMLIRPERLRGATVHWSQADLV